MSEQVPFHFVLELCFFAFLVAMTFRWLRLNKKRALTGVMERHGLSEADINKIPKKTRDTWAKDGVSINDFVTNYRFHVENEIT